MRRNVVIATLLGLTLPACADDQAGDGGGETGSTPATTSETGADVSSSEGDGADTTEADEPPPTACAEPTDISGAPTTIAEAVDFINALPRPVTLDCFVERLERPMAINATISTVSLQPAVGEISPRVFMFYDTLIMSVAIDGEPGRHLLEFGEMIGPTTSIKGELEFPVTEAVVITDPMERILDAPDNTKCRLCHGSETPTPEYEMAFASDALRFRDDELVELSALRGQYRQCDPAVEPERCRRLDSFFAFGEVVAGDFPPGLQTIYDYE